MEEKLYLGADSAPPPPPSVPDRVKASSHDTIFGANYYTNSKEASDVNQHFYVVQQCQKNNWIEKMDRVNRPLHFFSYETSSRRT